MVRTPLIMVVDSVEADISAVRDAFRAADHVFEMKTAKSLSEARQQLDVHSPDLVITKMQLPDGKAVDLIRASRACPVIVLSDCNDAAEATEAMKAGAADFVVKTTANVLELPGTASAVLSHWRGDEKGSAAGGRTASGHWRTIGALTGGLADRLCDTLRPLTRECEAARDDMSREGEAYWHLTSAIKAARQSQDLAEYLRTAASTSTQPGQNTAAETIIREAVRIVRAAAPPSIAIRYEVADTHAKIAVDPVRVRQLVYSVCLDAFREMPAGGLIEIRMEASQETDLSAAPGSERQFARLSFRDTRSSPARSRSSRTAVAVPRTGVPSQVNHVNEAEGGPAQREKLVSGSELHFYLPTA